MLLSVTNLNVYYGKVQVLWNVSFEVDEGELVAIVGPNGAGKTTTLKTIAGLLNPVSGEIRFKGENISRLPAYTIAEKGIALVPEGRRLFPNLTVMENLLIGAYKRKARELRYETLRGVFKLFPILEERKGQMAKTLSGGEAQMLAIARALMSRPTLLMMDEPSLGLAPMVVSEVFDMVKKLRETGTTILLVEQHVHHALELANRAYVLENGRVVLAGPGRQIREHDHIKRHYLGV